jgi:hypothetical protein
MPSGLSPTVARVRNPLHRSEASASYVGRANPRCDGQIRRLWLQLWEKRQRRDRAVGWVCTGCGRVRLDSDAFDGLETVKTGGGATALRVAPRKGDRGEPALTPR